MGRADQILESGCKRRRALRCAHASAGRRFATARRGLTLVEILVVLAVLALLMGILLPAIRGTMTAARSLKCQMGLRSLAFDFGVFADESLHGDRGTDAQLGRTRFRLETFQESLYGVDEFWRFGQASSVSLPDASGQDPLRCPECRGPVTLVKSTPCSAGAVLPPAHVSFGFNARLHVAEEKVGGSVQVRKVLLNSGILQHPDVPLAWDVDGAAAAKKGQHPSFSAPALDSPVLFAGDALWFPAHRHGGSMNVAFVGGHVRSTRKPLEESTWRWSHQPK